MMLMFKKLKKDIMKNARDKLKKWEVKKMVKKKDEEIPTLEENIENLRTEEETEEPKEEEPKKEDTGLRLVTSEQMIQFRLDTLSGQIEELNSQMKALVEILRKK